MYSSFWNPSNIVSTLSQHCFNIGSISNSSQTSNISNASNASNSSNTSNTSNTSNNSSDENDASFRLHRRTSLFDGTRAYTNNRGTTTIVKWYKLQKRSKKSSVQGHIALAMSLENFTFSESLRHNRIINILPTVVSTGHIRIQSDNAHSRAKRGRSEVLINGKVVGHHGAQGTNTGKCSFFFQLFSTVNRRTDTEIQLLCCCNCQLLLLHEQTTKRTIQEVKTKKKIVFV